MLGIGWFLLFTVTGLQVSSGLVTTVSRGLVSIGGSEGTMAGNWLLRDVLVNTEAVEIKIGKITCDWQPRRLMQKNLHILHVADLSIDDIRISIKSSHADADIDKEPFTLPSIVLPIPFLIGTLKVDDIQVVNSSDKAVFDARSFSARLMGDGNHLKISEVRLDAPYMGVTGSGRIDMGAEWPLTVNADWWLRIDGCTRFSGRFEGNRTLADPRVHIVLEEPDAVWIDADINGLFDGITYQASVAGSEVTLSDFCMQIPGVIDNLQIEVAGDLENYKGSGQASMVLNDEPLISAHIGFSGDREQLTIDTGSFNHGSNRFDAAGSLHFGSGFGWNATVSTNAFDLSELLPVPETLIDGNLNVYGEIDGDQLSYDADLRELGITISEHNLKIGGGLSLHGDQDGLEVTHSNFICGEGAIGVQGNVNWQDYVMWEADILLDSFNPAVIEVFPEGNISGELTSIGSFENLKLAVQAEIVTLYGALGGYELAGEGLVVYRENKLTIKDLNIANGNNSFHAKGEIDTEYNLMFQINGSELERVFPLMNGTLNIDGTMHGARSKPVLNVKADGKALSYESHGLEELHAEAIADLADKTIHGEFDLGRITSGNLQAERLIVDLDGSMTDHSISGVLTLPRTELSIHAKGSVPDTDMLTWHGEINKLKVVDNTFGIWKNGAPIVIDAGADSATVNDACLSSDENRLCTDIAWEQGNTWSLAVSDARFDLGSLNRWGVLGKPLTGIVEGEVSANGVAAEIESFSGHGAVKTVQWEPGPNSYYQDFRWFDTSCSLYLADRDLKVELSTRFVDDSTLDAEIGLIGITDFTDVSLIPVTGQINLEINDLKPLSIVTAGFVVPQGHALGTVNVNGTLTAPLLKGDVNLLEGELYIPFLGVDLIDVKGTIGVDGNSFDFELDSRAGDGKLNSIGEFHFGAKDWSGLLSFTALNSSLLNRRAISADANSNLELKLGSEGGALTGTVAVLKALVEVEKIDRSATESSDVVYVDKVIESTPWPFHYDIDVSLGDDVNVEGFGLTGKLGGNLRVASNTDGTTSGRGFLDVREGSFTVYGNPLEISRGRLSFNGGPVDNPGIDIKAVKFINENRMGYERIEVGANVIGSAADFEVELYSIPKMEKSDILTYLVLDNPFGSGGGGGATGLINSAGRALGFGKGSDLLGNVNSILPVDQIRVEGVLDKEETSLVVGKNLSKDLSVSYDYNLFNNAGSFRVRYEFGKGFSVESRNSFESNAVELMYSFER